MSGGVFARFGPGRAGASGAPAAYITRGRATGWDERAIATRNYPDEVREAEDDRDLRDRLEEYAEQQEAYELERPRRGGGETRTHYRGVLSFEGKVETGQARAIAAVHPEGRWTNELGPEVGNGPRPPVHGVGTVVVGAEVAGAADVVTDAGISAGLPAPKIDVHPIVPLAA